MSDPVPYTDDEAREAKLWAGRHGPANAWTASNGTAARMIGRLLQERERLTITEIERKAIQLAIAWLDPHPCIAADTLRGLLERTK